MANDELSARIVQLEETINQLKCEVKASAAAMRRSEEAAVNKSRFLAIAIHELRQPLQSLSLLHDALESCSKDANSLKFAERLGKAVTAATNGVNNSVK